MKLGLAFITLIYSSFAFCGLFICVAKLPTQYSDEPLTVSLFDGRGRESVSLSNSTGVRVLPVLHVEETDVGFMDQIGKCIQAGVWEDSCIETYFEEGTWVRNQVILEAVQLRNSTRSSWFAFDILQAKKAKKFFITTTHQKGAAGLTEYYDLNQNLMGRFFSPGDGVMVPCVSKEPKNAFDGLL